jgi:hypothetical protein
LAVIDCSALKLGANGDGPSSSGRPAARLGRLDLEGAASFQQRHQID